MPRSAVDGMPTASPTRSGLARFLRAPRSATVATIRRVSTRGTCSRAIIGSTCSMPTVRVGGDPRHASRIALEVTSSPSRTLTSTAAVRGSVGSAGPPPSGDMRPVTVTRARRSWYARGATRRSIRRPGSSIAGHATTCSRAAGRQLGAQPARRRTGRPRSGWDARCQADPLLGSLLGLAGAHESRTHRAVPAARPHRF